MRFLIINNDYPEFLRWLYTQNAGLEISSYVEQMRTRNESLFGVADFYSTNLRALGHEAWEIHANNEAAQKTWAREHGAHEPASEPVTTVVQRVRRAVARTPLRTLKPLLRPMLHSLDTMNRWFFDILETQIQSYKPDVLLNEAIEKIDSTFLNRIRPHVKVIAGQHAAMPLSERADYSCYGFVVSSFPATVDFFRRQGVPAELYRLAFEPRVLSQLKDEPKRYDVSFIGSFHPVHSSRVRLLEAVFECVPQLKIWAPSLKQISSSSPLRKCHMGQAWGREMYQVLRDSKITLNHHGDVAPFANNMRLYEATGAGTLLVTDWKENLCEMFEPEKEVVTYRTPKECAERIAYYLAHEPERAAIARAGQQRTLHDHTYRHRMQQLTDIALKYL